MRRMSLNSGLATSRGRGSSRALSLSQPLACHGVERTERLVHQHQLGIVGQDAGDQAIAPDLLDRFE
jgi:hypothetical protein